MSQRSGALARPLVAIDLQKISDNTAKLVASLLGIEIVAVTKATCGDPEVAAAMITGGAFALGDSRLENVERLRESGLVVPIWLLRAPAPELAADAVRLADVSLETEIATVKALSRAAVTQKRRHGVLAMVELGDLREGMMPERLPEFVHMVERLPNLDLVGIGANLTCFGAIVPDRANLGRLVALCACVERMLGRSLPFVSGGNSSSISMVLSRRIPTKINTLRLGESILLGIDSLTREPLPLDLHLDAFTISAPVIECMEKPSLPQGLVAQDAFGRAPKLVDRGVRRRAICAIGRQDVEPEGLRPLDSRIEVLGASSDHLILDVEALDRQPRPGQNISFSPTYAALLRAFTSAYVGRVHVRYITRSGQP